MKAHWRSFSRAGKMIMDNAMNEKKLEQVERLLRSRGPAPLSPQFTRNVLAALEELPAPALTAPPRPAAGWRYAWRLLGAGEKLGLGLLALGLLACLAALLVPDLAAYLQLASWELGELTCTVNIGETALSVSLVSVLAVLGLAGFMAGLGTYGARSKLIGA